MHFVRKSLKQNKYPWTSGERVYRQSENAYYGVSKLEKDKNGKLIVIEDIEMVIYRKDVNNYPSAYHKTIEIEDKSWKSPKYSSALGGYLLKMTLDREKMGFWCEYDGWYACQLQANVVVKIDSKTYRFEMLMDNYHD